LRSRRCRWPSAQVKIGLLNDQSGVYADHGGKYAIENFGDKVLGQKVDLVTADHQAADYALATRSGPANGGKVLGSVRVSVNSSDFSSLLLQVQSSNAKIVGLANAGLDTTDAIEHAAEFGIVKAGQKLTGLLMTISDERGRSCSR